jgi:Zn-dependent peptidase ImmA (M78 family)
MMSTASLAREALEAASRTRLRAGRDARTSVCVYDVAEVLELDVWFQPAASLEAIYSRGEPPIIVLSSLRPSGRQRMNCAHEVGHHVFGHGTNVHELDAEERRQSGPEEFLACCFADYLLMPKLAVLAAAKARSIDIEKMSPLEASYLASYFGVGLSSFVHHATTNLRVLPNSHADLLRRMTPARIRRDLGIDCHGELFLVDSHWVGRPIDLQVGDAVLLPLSSEVEGNVLRLREARDDGLLFEAVRPGIGRVARGTGWASYVRISRRVGGGGFVGRAVFRHEEEVDTDD